MRNIQFYISTFLLLAFAAVPAHADLIFEDPGDVGGNAQNFTFGAAPALSVDILWTDNKTLEYTSGRHLVFLIGGECNVYTGVLLDAAGNAIPDTEIVGRSLCSTGNELSAGVIDLPAATVFSGIRLFSEGFRSESAWQWNWESEGLPVVGQRDVSGNLPPVADTGGAYVGVADTPITFDASASFDPDGTISAHSWDFGDETNLGGTVIQHTYASAGVYNVTLTVTDDMGVSQSRNTIASIGNFSLRPTADAGGPYASDTSTEVQFDGSGSSDPEGAIDRYTWNFGDGSPPLTGLVNPQKGYTEPGRYTVVLEVEDGTGNTDIDIAEVFISDGNKAPRADAGPPVVGEINVPVAFDASGSIDPDGQIVRYDWDYGDGNTGPDAGAAPNHTYNAAGEYTVSVSVTDDLGAVDSDQTAASISPPTSPPVADAGGPYSALVGEEVVFDGTGSTDAQGPIASYEWDFGDASAAGSGATPSHTYATEGSFEVTLRVTDGEGLEDTATTTASISVLNQPPTADAGGPYSGLVDSEIFFNGTGSSDPDGDVLSAMWDFGDGDSADGLSANHTYAASGSYTAKLTVTDSEGQTDSDSADVVVSVGNAPPVAEAGGPYSGTAGAAVTFDGSDSTDSDGTIDTYAWTFGDTGTGNGAMVDHTYAAAGAYNVVLQVTDDGNLTVSDDATASIGAASSPPTADAGGPYNGTVDAAISFDASGSSDPDDDIVRYDWDYGDGSDAPDAGVTPNHTYVTSGKFVVSVTVTDASGEVATDSANVTVGVGNQVPAADAGQSVSGAAGASIGFDGSASSDPDGTIASYAWAFGDGSSGTGATPSHIYDTVGEYNVTLTVTDDSGAVSSDVTVATVTRADVSVQAKTKGTGSVGFIELLLLALASAFLMVSRALRGAARSIPIVVLVGVLVLASPGPSHAQEIEWYVGIGAGAAEADYDSASFAPAMADLGHTVSNVSIDTSDTGWQLYGGLTAAKYFGFEVGYVDLGEVSATFDANTADVDQMLQDANALLPLTGSGFDLAVIGRWPFGDRGAVFAKLGMFFWEAEDALSASGSGIEQSGVPTTDGNDVMYGIGGELYFPNFAGGRLGVRAEWERYGFDRNDVDLVSASVLIRF